MFSTMSKGINLVVKWSIDTGLRDAFERCFDEESLGNRKEKTLAAFAAIRHFLENLSPVERKLLVQKEKLRIAQHEVEKVERIIQQRQEEESAQPADPKPEPLKRYRGRSAHEQVRQRRAKGQAG